MFAYRFRLAAAGDRGGLFGAGGRFQGGVDPIMEKFNESISFDKRYVFRFPSTSHNIFI